MKTPADRYRHDVALFRYGLIADIMTLPPGAERAAAVRARADRAHTIPGSTRTRVSVQTLRDWIRIYERDGFDGLMPTARSDRAQMRRMSPDVIETLLSIKRDAPELSVRKVIKQPRDSSEDGETHAAAAVDRGRKRKTCLPAILDDATRVIPYARFSFADNTPAFLLVLREAITRRGLAARLYVDNGSDFRSRQLAMICARLGIAFSMRARTTPREGKDRQVFPHSTSTGPGPARPAGQH
ncbi:MAG: DDE-type integrase/transposase/recombinase [Chloroflexi bacterium]|nr:DDE-type integrase/transposase/recombinase [Chloroflexota bacterium]